MNFQDYMIETTQHAADEAFRYALAVPTEKAEWKPLESGRSVLDQAREMAKCPVWAYDLISPHEGPALAEMSEETAKAAMAEQREEMASWKSVEECHGICKTNLAKLFELYKSLPDERLTEKKWLPFDGGRDFTMKEMMDYPRWNFNYHLGQIGYIQTLYGDNEMH